MFSLDDARHRIYTVVKFNRRSWGAKRYIRQVTDVSPTFTAEVFVYELLSFLAMMVAVSLPSETLRSIGVNSPILRVSSCN